MPAQTLTNVELTALHTETIGAAQKAARESRTLANISRRASTLIEDGYQVRSYAGTDLHIVESPKGDKYSVWHGATAGFSCSCPCFLNWNTCKHLEAIDLMKKEAVEDAAADEEYELAEEARNFFDSAHDMNFA
ncbi:MAG: hypothetical protein ACRYFS_16165 [Janthinobacterium lividum]